MKKKLTVVSIAVLLIAMAVGISCAWAGYACSHTVVCNVIGYEYPTFARVNCQNNPPINHDPYGYWATWQIYNHAISFCDGDQLEIVYPENGYACQATNQSVCCTVVGTGPTPQAPASVAVGWLQVGTRGGTFVLKKGCKSTGSSSDVFVAEGSWVNCEEPQQ